MKSAVATVTTNGRFVIPSKLRRKYGIRKGTRVAMFEENGRIVLQPLTPEFIRRLRSSHKSEASARKIMKERRKHDQDLSLQPGYPF
jgi:AbrB family looped-hinge helix DNA binding protein